MLTMMSMQNRSPLWRAANMGSKEVIDLLLEAGANIFLKDSANGQIPSKATADETIRLKLEAVTEIDVKYRLMVMANTPYQDHRFLCNVNRSFHTPCVYSTYYLTHNIIATWRNTYGGNV